MSVWRNDIKCKYMFLFLLKNLARKGLNMASFYPNRRQLSSVISVNDILILCTILLLFQMVLPLSRSPSPCLGAWAIWFLLTWLGSYRLVSNIRRTSIIRRTPTLGNSQLEFSPTISLAKTSNTRRTPSFDFWVSIVDKVRSRPTWSELLRVAWDFDSPWIKGPMTPYQSRPYARHVTVIPAAKLLTQLQSYFFQ